MKLIDNWRAVLLRAWSSRILALIVVLSFSDTFFDIAGDVFGIGGVPFGLVSGALGTAALVARLTYQPSVHK